MYMSKEDALAEGMMDYTEIQAAGGFSRGLDLDFEAYLQVRLEEAGREVHGRLSRAAMLDQLWGWWRKTPPHRRMAERH